MTLVPGPLTYLLYKAAANRDWFAPLELIAQRKDLSTLIAGFAFAMLGFLAAVITILFGFTSSAAYRRYERRGILPAIINYYYFCIICLIITAILSVFGYSSAPRYMPFRAMLIMFCNCLVQIGIFILLITNLVRRASRTAGP